MFLVDQDTLDAIRRAFDEGGDLSALVEFRRHFPAISDGEQGRLCVRSMMAWSREPLSLPPRRARRPAKAKGSPPAAS